MMHMSTTDLVIGGMICASCATRAERKLNRVDGVTATVNLATETARVSFPAAVAVADLIAVVERTGYTAALPTSEPADSQPADREPGAARGRARRRLALSLVLAVPVTVLAMVPAARFPDWSWVSLALATPVAAWGAWPFHRAAVVNARHATATMDTLVSLGVAAAYLWSLAQLVADAGAGATYFEVVTGVTTLILLGRYLEGRARQQAGAALGAARPGGQAGDRAPGRGRGQCRGRGARGRRRDRGPAGGEDRGRRGGDRRALRGRHLDAHRRAGAGRDRPG
jgi:Cu+-exporting ATPase